MVAPEICGSDKYGEERERREIVILFCSRTFSKPISNIGPLK